MDRSKLCLKINYLNNWDNFQLNYQILKFKGFKDIFKKYNRIKKNYFSTVSTLIFISFVTSGWRTKLPLYSPMLESIYLVRRGKVRRSKLYYLRQRSGKSARIAEKKDVIKKKPKITEIKEEPVSKEEVKEESK